MKLDLCFVLIDLGDPWYKTAASEMIRSARRAYKDHDMRVVQLTDSKTALHPDADQHFGLANEVGKHQMCQAKGHLLAEYALKADRPVIFCDVDIIWNHASATGFLEEGRGVTVLKRYDMPSMPFNSGVIFTEANQKAFWNGYRAACENLPPQVAGWYGDQFALVAAVLDDQNMTVRQVEMDFIAPAPDVLPTERLTTPAVHFKGNRKDLMIPYARMLDGGEGFDFARPQGTPTVTRGNGLELAEAMSAASVGWRF